MSFALTPAGPFVDTTSVVTASWLNFVRSALPDAIDGIGGGTYALLPAHTLSFSAGGGDIDLGANTKIRDGVIPSGGQVIWQAGSFGIVQASSGFEIDGVFQVRGTGTANVLSGGAVALKSGSTFTAENGSTVALFGDNLLADNGGGGSNGRLLVGAAFFGDGSVVVNGGSDISIQPDGDLYVTGTSGHSGAVTWQNFGVAQFDSGSTLTMASGSAATLGGSTTQTNVYTRSGSAAKTIVRKDVIPNGASTATFTASQADIWEIASTVFTGGVTAELAAESGDFEFTIVQANANCGDAVIINEAGGAGRGTFNPSGGSVTNGVRAACRYWHRNDGVVFILHYWDGLGGAGPITWSALFTPPG